MLGSSRGHVLYVFVISLMMLGSSWVTKGPCLGYFGDGVGIMVGSLWVCFGGHVLVGLRHTGLYMYI